MGWINTLNLWKVEYGIVESIGFWTFSNDNWIIVIRIYSLFVKNKSRIKFMEFIEVLKLMYSTMINKSMFFGYVESYYVSNTVGIWKFW